MDLRHTATVIAVKAAKTTLQAGAALLVIGATISDQPWNLIVATSLMAGLASVVSNTIEALSQAEASLTAEMPGFVGADSLPGMIPLDALPLDGEAADE